MICLPSRTDGDREHCRDTSWQVQWLKTTWVVDVVPSPRPSTIIQSTDLRSVHRHRLWPTCVIDLANAHAAVCRYHSRAGSRALPVAAVRLQRLTPSNILMPTRRDASRTPTLLYKNVRQAQLLQAVKTQPSRSVLWTNTVMFILHGGDGIVGCIRCQIGDWQG